MPYYFSTLGLSLLRPEGLKVISLFVQGRSASSISKYIASAATRAEQVGATCSNVAPRARVFTRNLPAGAVFLCSIAREHEVLEGDTAEKNSAAGRFLVNTRVSGAT